jgi:hypothetical protein
VRFATLVRVASAGKEGETTLAGARHRAPREAFADLLDLIDVFEAGGVE